MILLKKNAGIVAEENIIQERLFMERISLEGYVHRKIMEKADLDAENRGR